jgi:hypothetical protein
VAAVIAAELAAQPQVDRGCGTHASRHRRNTSTVSPVVQHPPTASFKVAVGKYLLRHSSVRQRQTTITAEARRETNVHVRRELASRRIVSAGLEEIYTIFEGTSEIQRLVIARAISGMRIR